MILLKRGSLILRHATAGGGDYSPPECLHVHTKKLNVPMTCISPVATILMSKYPSIYVVVASVTKYADFMPSNTTDSQAELHTKHYVWSHEDLYNLNPFNRQWPWIRMAPALHQQKIQPANNRHTAKYRKPDSMGIVSGRWLMNLCYL